MYLKQHGRGFAAGVLVLMLGADAVRAQYEWEFAPRPGERRLGYNIFKASHNSYDRDETYVQQLDEWNCWCLELDAIWRDDALKVSHDCSGDPPLLSTALDRFNDATLTPYRITVIWLEWKSICNGSPTHQMIFNNLAGAIDSTIGLNNCYTPDQFLDPNGDNARWPSWQELVRRGKYWIVVCEGWPIPNHSPHVFRSICTGCIPSGVPSDSQVFHNHEETESPGPHNDNWMSRGYPEPTCPLEQPDGWSDGVSNGHNLVATNCISYDSVNTDTRVHPPQPCFVTRNDIGSAHEYGTIRDPFWGLGLEDGSTGGLLGAVYRVRTYGDLSEIWVQEGDYDFAGPITINGPCVITNWTGGGTAVVIR
ncbi:MAG: hypothetical protein U1A27_10385 [Phycisphaerae bacterium]